MDRVTKLWCWADVDTPDGRGTCWRAGIVALADLCHQHHTEITGTTHTAVEVWAPDWVRLPPSSFLERCMDQINIPLWGLRAGR